MSTEFQKALDCLQKGDIVGIPTETVYGLAGRIDQNNAIEKIFKVKNRPFFDPLIVHVSSIAMAKTLCCQWDQIAEVLAKKFWPGPLTMILPKTTIVNPLITSGLDGVGIRMPRHDLTLKLIESLGVPLAAPSANKFGRASPTSAAHVKREFIDDNIHVLDGGICEVGIESTVVLVKNNDLSILRSGHIKRSDIEKVLDEFKVEFHFIENPNKKESPGHMKHHYMPSVPLVLIENTISDIDLKKEALSKMNQMPNEIDGVQIIKPKNFDNFVELSLSSDPVLAARQFYSHLRNCADQNADFIIFYKKKYHVGEFWEALFDRIKKAASLTI